VQDIGQTLIYLLIALPVVAGIYLRYRTRARIPFAMGVYALVLGTLGLGFVMYHYNDQEHPLESYRGVQAAEHVLTERISGTSGDEQSYDAHAARHGRYDPGSRGRYRWDRVTHPSPPHYARLVVGGLLVLLFATVGAVMALLGPIVGGCTLAAALVSYFHGGSIHEIPVWKAFFDFFSINNGVVEALFLVGGSVLGAGHSLVTLMSQGGGQAPPVA
jgi:hypothetical protein